MQVRTGAHRASGMLALATAVVVALAALAPAAKADQRPGAPAPNASPAPLAHVAGWTAGPVGRWTGYHRPGGSRRVREVQRRLDRLGFHAGPVDGLFGPRTERAIRRFQRRHALRIDGVVGRHTLVALRAAPHRGVQADRGRHTAPAVTPPPPALGTGQVAQPVQPTPVKPRLPVSIILIALAVFGVASIGRSFFRTRRRIDRLQDQRQSAWNMAAMRARREDS